MVSVGWSSLLVAVLGVLAPFFLGWECLGREGLSIDTNR